jgi:hypothetical protein
VNRVQKLQKKAGIEPTDTVEVYYNVLGDVVGGDASVLQQVFTGHVVSFTIVYHPNERAV